MAAHDDLPAPTPEQLARIEDLRDRHLTGLRALVSAGLDPSPILLDLRLEVLVEAMLGGEESRERAEFEIDCLERAGPVIEELKRRANLSRLVVPGQS